MAGKSVLVYIEGEGGGGTVAKHKHNDGEFRKAWKQFLQPLAERATSKGISKFQCIPGRGGATTEKQFANPLAGNAHALRILLIDSEGPVTDVSKPWEAIKLKRPEWAGDKDCYLMVQCLETWLLADRAGLQSHYNSPGKPCFREKKLKAWQDLESIAKKTLQAALEDATADCGKPYAHADGNLLIGKVDLQKLKELSSVARLFRDFAKRIDDYAAE